MKRAFAVLFALVMAVTILPTGAYAGPVYEADVAVRYGQSEARGMLELVNGLRLGDDAWYWDETNTEMVRQEGLKAFVYDYDLEKAAMQRAAEIAVCYDHVRPDGSKCFTAYEWKACGENIAYGYRTAEDVFEAWSEADELYEGQGHRRNMLDADYTAFAVGHVCVDGVHYWVQEFRSPVGSRVATPAREDEDDVRIRFDPDLVPVGELAAGDVAVAFEETARPDVTARVGQAVVRPLSYELSVGDPSIAGVRNGAIYPIATGKTTYTVKAFGKTVTGKLIVDGGCVHIWDGGAVIRPATFTEEGEILYTCLLCFATRTDTIPVREPTSETEPPVTEPPAPAGLRGDADGDGKVLAKDARLVLRASARLETLDEVAFRRCDLDGNGKLLAGEARMILRYSAKLETAI